MVEFIVGRLSISDEQATWLQHKASDIGVPVQQVISDIVADAITARQREGDTNVAQCRICDIVLPHWFIDDSGTCGDCRRIMEALRQDTSCRCCGADLSREGHQPNCENA